MNCPLQKLLMEMVSLDTPNSPNSPQNQDGKTDAIVAPRRKGTTDVAQRMDVVAAAPQRKDVEIEQRVSTCIDGDPCCAMLLGRYFASMKTKDVEAFRKKLRKLVR